MGTGANAIGKAVKMGLPKSAMERASRLVIEQDPQVAAFHRKVKQLAKSKQIRTWDGRLHVFLGEGSKLEREVCNRFMQGGGAGLLNLTVVEIHEKHWPKVRYGYSRHDSLMVEIREADFTPELAEQIRQIAEQPRVINGMTVPFPGSFKVMNDKGEMKSYKFTKEVKAA
jgi:DNA polymerase I-like protein with 3'-5' exonuclease and polymerase domains